MSKRKRISRELEFQVHEARKNVEVLSMINRHAVDRPNNDGKVVRVPNSLETWRPAEQAKYRKLIRQLRKMQGGAGK